jgi:hypothetical protein
VYANYKIFFAMKWHGLQIRASFGYMQITNFFYNEMARIANPRQLWWMTRWRGFVIRAILIAVFRTQ